MATAYLIDNTAGTHSFVVLPGSLNGPGSVSHETDLRLYGPGSFSWGEGINENFYRLTENFACPESVLNPGTPMDAAELGRPGHGINDPIEGQLWFNTTTGVMMTFDGTNWTLVGGTVAGDTAPLNPRIGDLWFDTINDQLKVWNGTDWESTAGDYVLKIGDTMTGKLLVSEVEDAIEITSALGSLLSIKTTQAGGSIAPVIRLYNAENDPVAGGTFGTNGWTKISNRDSSILKIEAGNLDDGSAVGTVVFDIKQSGELFYNGLETPGSGNISMPYAAVTDSTHVTTKGYVDVAITTAIASSLSSTTEFLRRINNLSDVTNTTTARSNLGLGNIATVTLTVSAGSPSGGNNGDIWMIPE